MNAKEIMVLMVEPGRHPRVTKLHICGKTGMAAAFCKGCDSGFSRPVGEWSTGNRKKSVSASQWITSRFT